MRNRRLCRGGQYIVMLANDLSILMLLLSELIASLVMHRTVVVQTGNIRNRRYMEMLTFLAMLLAIVLILVSAIFWEENPGFFVITGIVWIAGCVSVILRFRKLRRIGYQSETAIPLPDMAELAAALPVSRSSAASQTSTAATASARFVPGNAAQPSRFSSNKSPASRRNRRAVGGNVSAIRAQKIAKNILVYSQGSKSTRTLRSVAQSTHESPERLRRHTRHRRSVG